MLVFEREKGGRGREGEKEKWRKRWGKREKESKGERTYEVGRDVGTIWNYLIASIAWVLDLN